MENLKESIKKLRYDTDSQVYDRIFNHILQAQRQSKEQYPTAAQPDIWRVIMKSSITKMASAVVVIIAVLVVTHQFGGSIDGTSVSWGDVPKRLDRVKDYSYRQQRFDASDIKDLGLRFRSGVDITSYWYYSSEFGIRVDSYYDGSLSRQVYTQWKNNRSISISQRQKTFAYRDEQSPQARDVDPRHHIRQIVAQPHVSLGRKTIEGSLAEGIEVAGQHVSGPKMIDPVTRLWVDVESGLPIGIECQGKQTLLKQDEFCWNVDLTEADLTPNIPTDFTEADWPWPPDDYEKQIDNMIETQLNTPTDFSLLAQLGLVGDEGFSEQPIRTLTGGREIWQAQEQVMRGWPAFDDVQAPLLSELDRMLGLNNRSLDELVQIGMLLREKFWELGGCLSPVSYRYGYMARILLQCAYNRKPNNLAVGDQLAEAIMAIETSTYPEDSFAELLDIRRAQFDQIRAEVEAGRRPEWDDFARVCDLIDLLAGDRNFEEMLDAVDWTIQNAKYGGGWEGHLTTMNLIRTAAIEGRSIGFNIYAPVHPGYPEASRFSNRPPSFKGPRTRVITPVKGSTNPSMYFVQ